MDLNQRTASGADLQSAGINTGDTIKLIQNFRDPVFGKIAKGEAVKVISIDSEGGHLLVEYKPAGSMLASDLAILPLKAVAPVVRNAPPATVTPSSVKETVKASTGLSDEDTVVITRSKLLRDHFRAQQQGSRYAMTQAKADITQAIKENFNNNKWEQATRSAIVDYIKQYIPAADRHLFLKRVAETRTAAQGANVLRAVIEKAQSITNKQGMKTVRILVDRILSDKKMPPIIKDRVNELISEIRLENWSTKNIDKLKTEQAFIDHLAETGEDVTVPQFLLDKLAKLNLRPLSELSGEEMADLLVDLQSLAASGKEIK